MKTKRTLDKLLNAGIVLGCISGVLCAARVSTEVDRAIETLARADRVITATHSAAIVEVSAAAPETNPSEDPAEDQLIEMAMLEQGYLRDDVPLPYDLQDSLHTACEEFGIRYELALAVIECETDFTATIGDGGESVGYFQIQPLWWGELMEEIGVDDLTDQPQNFRLGCAILAQLMEQFGNERDALTAYNSGHPGESEYATSVLEAAVRWYA